MLHSKAGSPSGSLVSNMQTGNHKSNMQARQQQSPCHVPRCKRPLVMGIVSEQPNMLDLTCAGMSSSPARSSDMHQVGRSGKGGGGREHKPLESHRDFRRCAAPTFICVHPRRLGSLSQQHWTLANEAHASELDSHRGCCRERSAGLSMALPHRHSASWRSLLALRIPIQDTGCGLTKQSWRTSGTATLDRKVSMSLRTSGSAFCRFGDQRRCSRSDSHTLVR